MMLNATLQTALLLAWAVRWARLHERIRRDRAYARERKATSTDAMYRRMNAALFFAHHLRTGSAADAVSRAASSVFGLLRRTAEAGSREILLVDAQQEFVTPTTVFEGERL